MAEVGVGGSTGRTVAAAAAVVALDVGIIGNAGGTGVDGGVVVVVAAAVRIAVEIAVAVAGGGIEGEDDVDEGVGGMDEAAVADVDVGVEVFCVKLRG